MTDVHNAKAGRPSLAPARRQKIIAFVAEYNDTNAGMGPSLEEIAEAVGWKTTSYGSISHDVTALIDSGHLARRTINGKDAIRSLHVTGKPYEE